MSAYASNLHHNTYLNAGLGLDFCPAINNIIASIRAYTFMTYKYNQFVKVVRRKTS